MQTEIEEFLKKHSPRLFLASEVADVMKISNSSAQRQLKKLVSKGRVVFSDGRYGSPSPPPPGNELDARIYELAHLTGIPPQVLEDWARKVKEKKGLGR